MSGERSTGGRPLDEVWKHVEKLENGRWKCKYCDLVSKGSASRIRNHLSGLGNDISKCEGVPKEVQEKARQKTPRKRQLEEDNQVQDHSPSLSNEESVTNAFLKFLMCNKFSSVGPDILQDPYFREFMERAQKHGVPSSLLRGDFFVIQKSLFNIKQEVHQYMLMVKESWNITGCTMMAFRLNHQYKGKVFTLKQDRYVYGFYCPKGFIFVEAPDCSSIGSSAFDKALEQHLPSFSFEDIARHAIFLHHSINHGLGDDHLCELSDKKLPTCVRSLPCLRHEIQGLCINTCKSSGWAQSLINNVHERLCHPHSTLYWWYRQLIMEKDEVFKNIEYINGKDASRLSNFISFMLLEGKLKEKLLYEMRFGRDLDDRDDLEVILDDSKFWGDGKHLLQVLTMTLRIPDLMDTLVPTAGYLAEAIDMVNDTLTDSYDPIPMGGEAFTFWKDLESKLRGTIEGRGAAASYLNPFYLLEQDVIEQTQLQNKVKLELTKLASTHYDLRGKEEKLHEELQKYGNVCLNHYEKIFWGDEIIHPVQWWEKYGNDHPLLRKHAIRLLSQPLNCMCNQVKKHMYQLQGADDFILRLNVRMMEEFKILGDAIYKHIKLYNLDLEDWLIG